MNILKKGAENLKKGVMKAKKGMDELINKARNDDDARSSLLALAICSPLPWVISYAYSAFLKMVVADDFEDDDPIVLVFFGMKKPTPSQPYFKVLLPTDDLFLIVFGWKRPQQLIKLMTPVIVDFLHRGFHSSSIGFV
ncbi:OLC1v1010050C1 [Oldenlandia corymbosa var. corymbosa]|uniref:OLC1v1010050C1 n=1 Tax=Oldenlandia corymbosa var. corymbosa TaxID=529605 RepID=A0AAV1DQD0_OLDCO|nr:OLC1v1010050C1 [Oldenlandia corymbosa var. corymbosa]